MTNRARDEGELSFAPTHWAHDGLFCWISVAPPEIVPCPPPPWPDEPEPTTELDWVDSRLDEAFKRLRRAE